MSVTTTSASATSTCTPSWKMPIRDAACAAPAQGNSSDAFDKCCKSAPINKYNDGCNMYCLALGQSQDDLSSCLTSNGIRFGQVFCASGNSSATATSSPTSTRSSETSSTTSTSTSTSSSTTSGSSASETSEGAAVINQPITKGGLGLLAMMFCSALFGVVA